MMDSDDIGQLPLEMRDRNPHYPVAFTRFVKPVVLFAYFASAIIFIVRNGHDLFIQSLPSALFFLFYHRLLARNLRFRWAAMKNVTSYISNGPAMAPREYPVGISRESIVVLVDSVRTASSGKVKSASAETAGSEKISLEGILLKRDGSLSPNSNPILDSAAEILRNERNMRYYVETYCGGNARNLGLHVSQSRASAVTAYLEAHGISANCLIPRECAMTNVAAAADTHPDMTTNHRVELIQID
jgi:OmpA family